MGWCVCVCWVPCWVPCAGCGVRAGAVRMRARVVVTVFVHAEFRRRHAGAQHLLRVHVTVSERQAAERAGQLGERQAGVEERAERHVAGDAGEAVEIEHAGHSCPASLKLQYRTSPSTT